LNDTIDLFSEYEIASMQARFQHSQAFISPYGQLRSPLYTLWVLLAPAFHDVLPFFGFTLFIALMPFISLMP
jgi:hypothetical protein